MQKTKFLVLLNWFKKTGKKSFQGVFSFAINFIVRIQGHKDVRLRFALARQARYKQITNSKSPISANLWRGKQIPNPPASARFSERAGKLQITNYKFQFKKLSNFLLSKLFKLAKFCFSTKVRALVSSFLILTLLSSSFFFYKNYTPSKADYTNYVNQTDWSGGADTVSTITPTTAEGWNKYYEKGTNISADASGVVVVSSAGSTTIDFTTEGDYVQEDSDGTDITGGVGKLAPLACGSYNVLDADSNSYSTVLVGDQCWMGQNMRVGTMVADSVTQTNDSIVEKYCYANNSSNCTTYGGLYQWNEAMQYSATEGSQGICPSGWHIPTDTELYTLESGFATGTCSSDRVLPECDPAGTALKPGGVSGLNFYLAGRRGDYGGTSSLNTYGFYWSSTQSGGNAWTRYLASVTTVYRTEYSKLYGNSVRCIQNLGYTAYSTTPAYITTSNNSKIDVSTYSAITDVDLTQTAPTNTDIKYLVSFDGRVSWKYWDGTAWQTSTLADLQTNGMSKTTLEGLLSADWSAVNGFQAGITTTLDFAMDLSTTDSSAAPSLDQILVNYEYYPVNTNEIDFTTNSDYIHEDDTKTEVAGGVGRLKQYFLSAYPPEHNSAYVKATTFVNSSYTPYFATNPALSLTGSYNSTNWLTSVNTITNQRFHIDLGSAKNIDRIYYQNSHHNGGATTTGSKNFTLWGSNEATAFDDTTYANNTNWTQITGLSQSQFDIHVSADTSDPKYINISSNEASYRYYAFKIADNWGDITHLGLRHIELQENSYSTTPFYLTTSDTSQINTTDYFDINGITLTQTTSVGTGIKYLISFDGRTTWKYWDGDSWETSSLDDLQTNGMSKTTLEGLLSDDWSAVNGFIAGTTTTLDFAMDLSTTDNTVTPELDNIAIEYSQGLISSKFNSESTKNSMGGITWDEDATLPANSQVSLSLRTSSSEAGLDSQPWSTIGVSTPSSLTTSCTKSGTTVTCDTTTIPSSMKVGGDDQWFQYKLSLTRGDDSPTVTNINPIYLQDIEAPTITSITSSTINGEYKQGDSINLTINFSEDVISTTGLTLTLNAGGTAVISAWSTPTNSVSGTYTVGATPTSALSVSSVAGTISDQPGNSVAAGNLDNINFTTEGDYILEDNAKTEVVGGVGKLEYFSFEPIYPPSHNDTYVKATSIYSDTHKAYFATDPSLPVTGTWSYNNWLSAAGADTNQRFHIDLGSSQNINRIYYENSHHIGTVYPETGVKNFTLWGSNDPTSFAELTYGNDTGWTQITGLSTNQFEKHVAADVADPKYIKISGNSASYRYYAFKFADNWVMSYMGVRHLELQTGATYIIATSYFTTSDASQINTANYVEINGVTLTQTTPFNTDIKYLVSFDDRTTWKYWDGDSWEISSLDDLQTNGMDKNTLEGLLSTEWSASGGFQAGTTATLDFAMDLSTTDASVTPELDNIEIEYSEVDPDYTNSAVNPTISSNLEATSTIVIDNTAPTSSISVPNGTQAEYYNMAEISGTASDNNTLASIYVSIKDIVGNLYWDGDSWEALQAWLPNTTGTTSWTYDSSGVVWDVNTEYLIESKAVDEAGNQETPGAGKTFTFVNAAPIVSNVSASKTSTTVEVVYDVTDDGSAETTVSLVYDSGATLQTEMNNTTTSNIEVSDISIFPSAGTILMQSGTGEETRYEYLSYTGISGNFLTGITRATQSTLGYAHTIGTTIYLKAETTTGDSGLVTNGTTKSLTWNVASDNNFYDSAQIVGVVSHDGASANQIGLSLSSSFILDSTTPSIDTNPLINALTVPAQLSWVVSDDTALQMMISLNSDFSGASWEPYSANPTITLATNPDTVYIKFKDSQDNATTDQILTTPNTPESLMIQDVSSVDQAKWRLYTSWQIVSTPTSGFEAYRIYRSTTQDGTYTYQGSTASGDIDVDYFADTVLENDEYFYKIATEDQDGNVSFYSDFVWGIANAAPDAGEGGGGDTGDSTPPTINPGPTSSSITNNSATISWATNETADSFIEYGTTTEYGKVFGNSTTGTSHSVLLENLSGSTTYHYRVRTRDLAGNLTTSTDGTFTTSEGGDTTAPIISVVTTGTPNPTSVTITWTTDENSNSLIDFGTVSNTYTGTQGNSEDSTTSHSITLASLAPDTTYYYQVKSQDFNGNQASDNNSGTGFSFTTASAPDPGDTTAPTISNLLISNETATGVTISWATNELSDSIVGFSQDETYIQEQGSATLTQTHSVTLTGLTPSSTYYFQVKSRDANGNLATTTNSATQTFDTLGGEDTNPPLILSGPTSSSITSSSATISWTTDENSNSLVDFGTTTNTYTGTQGNGEESTTTHSILLNNLTPGETYYFKVRSLDSNNNQATSEEAEFTTISSPTITAVTNTNLTDDSTTITFTTSTNSYGYIDYGTTTGSYTETKGELSLATSHSINLTSLIPGTEYFYQVRIKDLYGNYSLDATEYSFTTNSGDTPTLNSFTSTTSNNSYNQGDSINITATYSEAIATGSITVKLDTGAEVELTGTGTTLTGTYTIQAGENSASLTVSEIQVQNVCDVDNNCLTSITLPLININTNSTIIVDTTNPTITSFTPASSTTITNDNISFTLGENITSGVLTVTQTGGTEDLNSPHTYNLSGTDLTSGAHSNLDPGMTLVNGSIYTFSLAVTDLAGNTTTETQTGITYDTDSMTLISFSSTSSSDTYGPTETINITATYSKEIASGELTVTLDTGATVILNTINSTTLTGVYAVGATGSGENSADLTVSSVDSETVCDSVNNCPTSVLPATNINTNSTIIVDTTAPVFTVSSPTNNSNISNLTTTSNLSYQIDENLTVGNIIIALVSGTDDNAPHTCTLTGTNLNAGTYTNFNTTNCQEGEITLTNQGVYNFEFSGTDGAGNSGTTQRTGVVFNPSASVITISAVSSGTPTSTSTTVTFTTSENSYGYIDYGTTTSYGKVQGNNVTPTTSHSITLEGLTPETIYHFRPRVKSLTGDYTLGDDETFLTAEDPAEPSEEGPEISNVRVDADSLSYNQATVEWETDEEGDSAVIYGTTLEYGDSKGDLETLSTFHSVTLNSLSPETLYYFKVRSMNSQNNFTTDDNSSSGYTFSTLSGSQGDQISNVAAEIEAMIENLTYTEEEIMEAISNISSNEITSSGPKESLENNIDVTISWTTNKNSKGKIVYKQADQDNYTTLEESILDTTGYTKDHEIIIKNLNPQTDYEYYVVSTSILGNQISSDINNFTTGETPKISNVMVNNTSLNEATISWTTNSIKTSILEYGTSTKYGTEKEESSSTNETNQTVLLTELEAGQEYHFRIRGIDEDEETTTSNDYTFITAALPVISNINISDIGIEAVTIKWETNSPTDSLIEYAFQGEEQGTSQGVLEATTDHTIVLEKLIPGVNYQATIYSKDQYGNQASSELITFTTLEDNNPPSIQNISSDTTMYPGEELKIQTVISWVTSKDSYSAIAFRKGAGQSDAGMEEKLQELVKQENEDTLKATYNEWTLIKKPVLTKNHLFILAEFDPSSVYQYKVISIDKRGNSAISKDYSFLTPSKRESIFDLIIANLEETFGWVRNVR